MTRTSSDNGQSDNSVTENSAAVNESDVASGAWKTALARAGALVDIVAQPAYVWMFGLDIFGLYIVLWSLVNFLATFMTMAINQALQRMVPAAHSDEEAHAIVRYSLLITILPAMVLAAVIGLAAHWLAPYIGVSAQMRADLPLLIAVFAWSIPLFIALEMATSAVRAKRAFGPEIRLRIFWEQASRLAFAALFFACNILFFGLFLAHILSLLLTSVLALKLMARFYDWRLILNAPLSRAKKQELWVTGFAMMPPFLVRRAFNDLPPVALNVMLAGQAGAVAAGLYGVARKIASVPLIVRQSFLYVLAPLSAEQKAKSPEKLAGLYYFSNRLAVCLALPLAGFMMGIADIILMLFPDEAATAFTVTAILLIGRAGEAAFGAATPIVEMTGHRILPLVNSILGLALAAGLAIWLLPMAGDERGADAMALSVAAGVVFAALLAMVEIWWAERLSPFDPPFIIGLVFGALVMALFGGLHVLLADIFWPWRLLTCLLLFFAILWCNIRFILPEGNRRALGKWTVRLKLASAEL